MEERVKKLESEVDMLRKWDRQRTAEEDKADVWRYEVLRMLRPRGIEDCTDAFFGYKRLVGNELEPIIKDACFKAISSNTFEKSTFYKSVQSNFAIYGLLTREIPTIPTVLPCLLHLRVKSSSSVCFPSLSSRL